MRADFAKRAAYDLAFAACKKLGNSSSTCRNGRSGRLPVVALGTAPPQFLEVDTRTGVAVEGTSDGRVGLEFGIEIGSGSVDATVSDAATLDMPVVGGSVLDAFGPSGLAVDESGSELSSSGRWVAPAG